MAAAGGPDCLLVRAAPRLGLKQDEGPSQELQEALCPHSQTCPEVGRWGDSFLPLAWGLGCPVIEQQGQRRKVPCSAGKPRYL